MIKLDRYTQAELSAILEETGHVLTLDDFSDIVELNQLCMLVNGEWEEHNRVLDFPVLVGGVKLYQPKLGALEWYESLCVPALGDDIELCDIALAMIMSDPELIDGYYDIADPNQIKKVVKAFKRRLHCRHDELRFGIAQAFGREISDIWIVEDERSDDKDDGDSGDGSNADKKNDTSGILICVLTREYGNSPEYWLWQAPLGVVNTMYQAIVARVEQEREDVRRQCKGGGKPPPAESVIAKFQAMRKKINEMRDKWATK